MKIYSKKGKKNYKENRMLKDLEKAFSEKASKDPEFEKSFVPANNESELRALHTKYCAEDVEFIETKDDKQQTTNMAKEATKPDASGNNDVIDATSSSSSSSGGSSTFVDPFNRDAPIVRDYVLNNDALGNTRTENLNPDNSFSEPTTFNEAFTIPEYDNEGKEVKEEPAATQGSSQQKGSAPKPKPEPMNPSFESMENGKKKRSAKKFAKYIVEAVLMLSKQGFVWYANKDINPAKLAEYEINGEIDLNILITLDNGSEATIKEFFQQQCLMAEQLSEVSPAQKEDLIDTLTEVMLEKGIAPTPMQELALISASVFGQQAITLFALKSQSNSLLMQLKAMKKGDYEPAQQNHQQYQQQQEPENTAAATAPTETNFEDIDAQVSNALDKNEIDEVIETKE